MKNPLPAAAGTPIPGYVESRFRPWGQRSAVQIHAGHVNPRTVRPFVSFYEPRLRQRCRHHLHLDSLSNIRNHSLKRPVQIIRRVFFHRGVRLASPFHGAPLFVRLVRGAVNVNGVLPNRGLRL